MRRSLPDKANLTKMSLLLQFLWRFFTISSRLISIGLFITAFTYWIFPIAIGHWGIMTIWVMHQGTHFCADEQAEYFFNMIIGAIYLVCFLNIKDEPTRCKYTSYYVLILLEDILLLSLWYIKSVSLNSKSIHLNYLLTYSGLLAAFFLGILFMVIYYRFFHPNGKQLMRNKVAKCC